MIATVEGEVLWEGVAWIKLHGGSTELLEATALQMGTEAGHRWLASKGLDIFLW